MVREQQPLLCFLSPIPVPRPCGNLVIVPFVEVHPEILDDAPDPFSIDDEEFFLSQREEFDGDVEHMAEGMVEDP